MGCASSDYDPRAYNPSVRRDVNNFQPVNLGKGITNPIKIKYFDLHGRADPLVQMFEYHG